MYEFYGVKKCQLLNILENGGKAIIPADTLTNDRKECCPLKPMPEKKEDNSANTESFACFKLGYNACIDELLKGEEG